MVGVAQNIACLVSDDGRREAGVGSFQDSASVFNLLCALAQQFDAIATMIEVGTEATWKAGELRRKAD